MNHELNQLIGVLDRVFIFGNAMAEVVTTPVLRSKFSSHRQARRVR
jgi:hypothetical protein